MKKTIKINKAINKCKPSNKSKKMTNFIKKIKA